MATPAWTQDVSPATQAGTDNQPAAVATEFVAGHGSWSIEYAHTFDHGDYQGPAGADSGQVQFQSIILAGDYFVADRWEVRASIPYARAKAEGMQKHPQLPCPPPGGTDADCGVTHVDNGDYHGTWADWDFGLSYHATIADNYFLAPSFDVYVPSHNYAYYGSGVIGQRVTKYGIGILLEHQLAFSEFYYTVDYQYIIKPRILGIDSNYNELAIDLGYFVTPKLGLRLITDFKVGHGVSDDQIGAAIPDGDFNIPLWRLHDKVRLQNHANAGVGVDYVINDRYLLSTSLLHSFWGQSNSILKYGLDLKLTRSF
ncbi:MAG: hypothetical protein ACREPN_07725 [Rudaea sp.]